MAKPRSASTPDSKKELVQIKAKELIQMTDAFAKQHLDEDYRELCEKMILKMARKRQVPFLSGRPEIWAAAVVYAIGSINFLFDKSFQPYATSADIANAFGCSSSTICQKAAKIRQMFNLSYYDPEFSTQRMQRSNPMAAIIYTPDGFALPISAEMLRKLG
jgi:hypothetical protein